MPVELSSPPMDDRRAHFLTMLGDVCIGAGLASISVEFVLSDGTRVSGTPSAQVADDDTQHANDSGYASLVHVNGDAAQLEDVVELVIRTP